MAIFTLYDPSVFNGITGEAVYTTRTATQLSINYVGSGYTINFSGSFTYTNGDVTGGFVNAMTYVANGVNALTISGLGFSLSQFEAASLGGPDSIAALFYGGNDQFFGSIYGEILTSHGGADTVIALDGDDVVYGGAGNDDVNGNVGADVVHGDAGSDFVRGGRDNDTVYGDDGDDVHVNGNIGDDLVFGGAGADTVYGGQGQDTLHGNAGNDLLAGDLGFDILYGEAGADRFTARAGSQLDWVADFSAAEGDKIQLAPGTAYTVGQISGQVVINLGGGDQLGLTGVAAGTFSTDWIVFA